MIIDFGISTCISTRLPTPPITVLPQKEAELNLYSQSAMGDIAETLAEKQITGERTNRIPQDYAYDSWKTDFKTGQTKRVRFAGEY